MLLVTFFHSSDTDENNFFKTLFTKVLKLTSLTAPDFPPIIHISLLTFCHIIGNTFPAVC